MNFSIQAVKELASILRSCQSVQRLEISNRRGRIILSLSNNGSSSLQTVISPAKVPDKRFMPVNSRPTSMVIISPEVGRFYRKSADDDKPLVNIGDFVHQKQIIGIVAMFREGQVTRNVESGCQGIVKEILVKDGVRVDCATKLFVIESTES